MLGTTLEPNVTAGVISFPVSLARPRREGFAVYVDAAEAAKAGRERSARVRTACGESGTVAAPTASPGYLCVYAALEDFRDRDPAGGVPTHRVDGATVPFVDAEFVAILNRNQTEGVNKTGASVAFGVPDIRTPEEEASHAYPHILAHGTWAVTAP